MALEPVNCPTRANFTLSLTSTTNCASRKKKTKKGVREVYEDDKTLKIPFPDGMRPRGGGRTCIEREKKKRIA